jgi:hypothetical protein
MSRESNNKQTGYISYLATYDSVCPALSNEGEGGPLCLLGFGPLALELYFTKAR